MEQVQKTKDIFLSGQSLGLKLQIKLKSRMKDLFFTSQYKQTGKNLDKEF